MLISEHISTIIMWNALLLLWAFLHFNVPDLCEKQIFGNWCWSNVQVYCCCCSVSSSVRSPGVFKRWLTRIEIRYDNMHLQYKESDQVCTETVHINTQIIAHTHTYSHTLTRRDLLASSFWLDFRASQRRAECWTPGNPQGWCLWRREVRVLWNKLRI